MNERYKNISQYLHSLQSQYNVHVCIKDYCGFISINKDLNEALRPFLAHTNPFCLYMKSDLVHWRICLSMIRKMKNKLEREQTSFFGICHAGIGEYVVPIYSNNVLLGSINAGCFRVGQTDAKQCISASCQIVPALDTSTAMQLYKSHIHSPKISSERLLPGLELLAEYLGETYASILKTHVTSATVRYRFSSEDTILSHALEYIGHNLTKKITVSEIATFCHCSDSYLSRIIKKRTGLNINIYINKLRVEHAKELLVTTSLGISEIALNTGFNDSNYFTRIFTKMIGIPPSQYRARFSSNI